MENPPFFPIGNTSTNRGNFHLAMWVDPGVYLNLVDEQKPAVSGCMKIILKKQKYWKKKPSFF